MKRLVLVLLFCSLPAQALWWSKKAKKGDLVQVEYKGTLNNGSVFDSNIGTKPFMFKIGAREVLPKFEEAIIGMKLEESKKVFVPAKEAYGIYSQGRIIKVPLTKLPPDIEEGGKVNVKQPSGYLPFPVKKIDGDFAFIDMNHPLADEDLSFEIKLLDIIRKKS